MSRYEVAVVGAGPAGIMAAITASGIGRRTAIIDKNDRVGRKLLVTGNGRCNLTNLHPTVDRYHGSTPEFIQSVISRFDQDAVMAFFQDLGLVLKEEENGRIFPRTNQASSVAELLRRKLLANGVDLMLETQVKNIERSDVWKITLLDGKVQTSERLVLATGGRAAHHLGSTGDGLYWAEKLGHTLTPIYPALVPMETAETWPQEARGTKIEAVVRATADSQEIGRAEGDVLFTEYGVSGPGVMALAGAIAPHLETATVRIHIDIIPDLSQDDVCRLLFRLALGGSPITPREALTGIVPSALIPIVLRLSGVEDGPISKAKLLGVVRTLKDMTLTITKLRRLREAQVTMGGVDTREINPETLESRLIPGLYFAGEIMDVHGDSGGFNLQWAWSSGHVAGLG